jgi:hypothetical protein
MRVVVASRLVLFCAFVSLLVGQLAIDAAGRWFGVQDSSSRATLIGDTIFFPALVCGLVLAVKFWRRPPPTLPAELVR